MIRNTTSHLTDKEKLYYKNYREREEVQKYQKEYQKEYRKKYNKTPRRRINKCLFNGLRMTVNGHLMYISHPDHPHTKLYRDTIVQVELENPDLGRNDVTKESCIRIYKKLGIKVPDLDVLKKKPKAVEEGLVMDYFDIHKDNRQVVIKNFRVDGLKDGVVYEFFGDFFHANPKKYSANLKIFNISAKEKWEKDEKRLREIKKEGYNVRIIWESDWNSFKMNEISEKEFLKLTKIKWYEYVEVMGYKIENYLKEVSNRIRCKLA
tara:strand:- start:409 stop:1200 length:792 start_codon:yes stop_codon:yes gene_type:complete